MCNLNQTIIKNNLRKIGVYLGEKTHNRLTTFVLQNTKRNVLQLTFVFSKGKHQKVFAFKSSRYRSSIVELDFKICHFANTPKLNANIRQVTFLTMENFR